ncbi:TetR/AcrR family transcriptional regulator [Caulobacter sp. BP25]|uniref:TetR/AcrR family transcriptional regulator n=1 Tax=Caulobacter sp. BP25 TaxID=2048900 RepID=UPI000C12AC8E|nr:TetR family transcriptional regulator [Caulobacter sp. BP25]
MATQASESQARSDVAARVKRAASTLFYQRGILAVGVNEIASAAGATKMSLYRHFRSKDELVIACLEANVADELDRLRAIARQSPNDPLGQLRAIIADAHQRMSAPGARGWMLANAAIEIPDPSHPIRAVCAWGEAVLRSKILQIVRRTGLSRPEALTDGLLLVLYGAAFSWRGPGAGGPSAAMVETCEALLAYHAQGGAK